MKRRDHEKVLRRLKSQSPHSMWQIAQILKWNYSPGIGHEDDREVILISFTFLEDALKSLLKIHFDLIWGNRADRLFEGTGGKEAVLGSLYSRTVLAETLDLISVKCQEDLESINLVRNTFAHSGHYLKFDNPSLIFFANLQTISDLGDRYDVRMDDGTLVFYVNLVTPRAKILGFIALFWIFCSIIPPPGVNRFMAEIFGPKLPLPDKLVPPSMSKSELADRMQEALANPPRSSPV